jgi:hypothetical protein
MHSSLKAAAVAVLFAACGGESESAKRPSVVAELPGATSGLIADHGDLFWFDAVNVFRVSTAGGVPAPFHTNDCGPHYGFAVDASSVYLGTCTRHGAEQRLISRSRRDGSDTTLFDGGALDVATLDDDLFAVHCNGGLTHVPPGGASPVAVDVLGPDTCATNVDVSGGRVLVQDSWSSEGPRVVSVDPFTGESLILGFGRVLAVDAGAVFLGHARSCEGCDPYSGIEEIVAVSPSGGAELVVASAASDHHQLRGAASDGQSLYFSEVDLHTGSGSLQRVGVDGSAKAVLLSDLAWPDQVAVDGRAVYYWEGEDEGPGRLMRLAR